MRMVNNIRLNVDAFHDGSIHDGTIIGLWECGEGENQLWKMVPQQDEPKPQAWDYLSRMPSVRVYTKAETNCSLAIREGEVILARANLSDPTQHWLKVEKYSTEVKDEYGFPSFALVNKATGQAMKPAGASHPVELITYVPEAHDETVLWTLAEDLGDGYRAMRMVNNTLLNVDALHDGSIHDGTSIGLWEWLHGENQLWKVVPHPDVPTHQVLDRLNQMPSIRVYTKAETHCSLAIRDGNVIVAWADTSDPSQVLLHFIYC
ncbi:hypothetical protein DCAR_0102215 [Daucus carota subsp. sativus]|uniref:Ricin B lectin domain-containing protein n=1 Tax=Daucus carota subsp. sativus TaxID=79200 RepID=A0AAF1AK03_DAUCS|nr:hypothetical protein DCAR_0102215 [Daucus carota subsp. sativus]